MGGFTPSQLSAGEVPASAAALSEQAGYRLSCAHVKRVCHFLPNAVPGAPIFKRALLPLRGEALPVCHRLWWSGDFPGTMLMKSPDFHRSLQPCCSSSCSHQELSSARCFSRNNLFIYVLLKSSLGVGVLSDHPDGAGDGAGQDSFSGIHFPKKKQFSGKAGLGNVDGCLL